MNDRSVNPSLTRRGKPRKMSLEAAERIRTARMKNIPPVEERFWSKVDKETGPVHPELGRCWLWTASIDVNGRGRFGYEDRNALAYRVALILEGREVPDDMDVDHMCRNVACVRPSHLRVVTERTNAVENNTSPFARNAQKTHCKYGHEFNAQNTVWHKRPMDPGPTRCCIVCRPYHANSKYRIDPPLQPGGSL